ncbi:MAG: hypothetical protein QXV21_00785 [Candidatus Bathyarchaeia archaeon]
MTGPEKYGKRRQITFRIGPIAQERLEQTAALFNMKPSEYAKAVLYRDLGVFNEALDQRKRSWRQKRQQQEEFDFDSETEENSEPKLKLHGRHSTMANERIHARR